MTGSLSIPQITVGSPSPEIEPTTTGEEYRSYPFRPDVVIDGWSTATITIRGASQRGHLHRYNGAPRQDDFATHALSDGRIIVAVADGVSAAKQSHIGATAAVNYAAGWLRTHLAADVSQTDWVMLMKSTAYRLAEQAQSLFKLAAPDPVVAEEQLATTLVCAVIEPLEAGLMRAHLVGIGDSGAWLLSSNGFRALLGGKAITNDGLTSSAVIGLPRVPSELCLEVVDFGGSDVLLLGSDGIGDPLGSGQGGVGNLLRDLLTATRPPSLVEFAHALDFSRENFDDDRTLVAVWPRNSEVMLR
ncbi:protein phosphatase 2C domain-containing protein [Mycobacterium sp.]|uniref:protein phosphatase 2C domain-containing protein n=1 Tax=Mycobacterium sp. TaxID=1785 RepID=UPI0025EB8843|nr:protein phosphatase 2C domain-containing protein [Mycobacterium sp.]